MLRQAGRIRLRSSSPFEGNSLSNETSEQNQQKRTAISELIPGQKLASTYLLSKLEQRSKKNGDPFFMLQLSDATGNINGVMWDNHLALQSGDISQDDFVKVSGDVGEFNDQLQFTVKRMERLDDAKVELKDFLPVSLVPRETLEERLDQWMGKVNDAECQTLLKTIFGHEAIREHFCTAPAAVRIHQAYLHGLLEHTLNVMYLADKVADLYEPIDRDLLITATLIHDIGKIRELDWKRSFTYTTEGRLLGHISIGASMIDQIIRKIQGKNGFDDLKRQQIVHIVLSHHGKMEWGSPVIPKTKEARVLHYADHTEAYMASFQQETEKFAATGNQWTTFNKMFESYLFTGAAPTLPSEGETKRAQNGPKSHSPDIVMDDV